MLQSHSGWTQQLNQNYCDRVQRTCSLVADEQQLCEH